MQKAESRNAKPSDSATELLHAGKSDLTPGLGVQDNTFRKVDHEVYAFLQGFIAG